MNKIISALRGRQDLLFALVFVAAIVTRLLWPEDMEWKLDEKLMHSMAASASESNSWPLYGMISGVGLVNSGFSIWPFILFYKISSDPLFMAICVMGVNIVALVLMLFCAGKMGEDGHAMRFGVLIMAVNLMAVIFSRKIWAQDLLPIFVALLWLTHIYRQHLISIFFWGVLSALMGQLHMSGFYYAFGLFVTAVLYKQFNRKRIFVFAAGFALGLIPALEWILRLIQEPGASGAGFSNILKFQFYLNALTDTLGINVVYSLGKHWKNFATGPEVFGVNTYLPVILSLAIAALFIYSVYKSVKASRGLSWKTMKNRPLVFYFISFVIVPGILLTLSGVPVRSHYLIAAAPFLHSALAWLFLKSGNKPIWILIFCQLGLTLLFLYFVHLSPEIHGDYGIPYSKQIPIQ